MRFSRFLALCSEKFSCKLGPKTVYAGNNKQPKPVEACGSCGRKRGNCGKISCVFADIGSVVHGWESGREQERMARGFGIKLAGEIEQRWDFALNVLTFVYILFNLFLG